MTLSNVVGEDIAELLGKTDWSTYDFMVRWSISGLGNSGRVYCCDVCYDNWRLEGLVFAKENSVARKRVLEGLKEGREARSNYLKIKHTE